MFGLGPEQAGDASHLDLHAVPASHCVGRRPLGKWGGRQSLSFISFGRKSPPPPKPPSGIPGPRRWKASVRTCERMFREDAEDEGMTTTPQGNVTTFVLQVGG